MICHSQGKPFSKSHHFVCCVYARAHVCALMTQKLCTVGMRNAILSNHLKVAPYSFTIVRARKSKAQAGQKVPWLK